MDARPAAEDGNVLTGLRGDFGQRMKRVRARVARFPYLDEGRNEAVDVANLAPAT